ncbi:hypothetical protein PIB30_100088 [Stylosanthes scabra]|uniref:DUF4283 domain-containing protein n=1 Tax=Stylosanthes scabra TaxID=79078 RepID=A0ABU6SXB9_9FABA|nr:hypothetical protein [Stylosanthes scabra]
MSGESGVIPEKVASGGRDKGENDGGFASSVREENSWVNVASRVSFRDKVMGPKEARSLNLAGNLIGDHLATMEVPQSEDDLPFDLLEDKEYVLLRGPWMLAGHYLAVKPWDASFNSSEAIGKPVKVDLATKSAEHGKFARACYGHVTRECQSSSTTNTADIIHNSGGDQKSKPVINHDDSGADRNGNVFEFG